MSTVIIKNANIITLDDKNTGAKSLSIDDGRITNLWTDRYPAIDEKDFNSETKVLDLKGKTIMPGFIDTHNHLLRYSMFKKQVDCSYPLHKSIKDILFSIKMKAKSTPAGDWIEAYGYDDTLLEDQRHPTRSDLDEVSPNNPVYINHISGHIAVVNSEAFNHANIEENIEDMDGGYFGRDENGKLNGVLYELSTMNIVKEIIPKPIKEEMIKQLSEGAKDYLAQGITTCADAAVGMDWGEVEIDAHLEASTQGINPLRMQFMIIHSLLKENTKYEGYTAEEINKELIRKSKGLIKLDSAKLFQDGSIQGLTGALRRPYHNQENESGKLIHKQEDINQEVLDLHRRGFRIAVHGNGDCAINSILDAYEYALQEYPLKNHKHRIEHAQTATEKDLDRMKRLNVAASFFINHVFYWGDRHKKMFLGSVRSRRLNPLAEAKERDLLFTLHSDCPITPISPLFSVWAAVNRITREGEVLGQEQSIDVITALKSMTIYGAKLIFQEDELGSIEVGKRADLIILDENPTMVNPMKIKDINILATIVDGKIEYSDIDL